MPRLRYCTACGGQKSRAARMEIGDTLQVDSLAEAGTLRSALRAFGAWGRVHKTDQGATITRVAGPTRGALKRILVDLPVGASLPVPTRARANVVRSSAHAYGIRLRLQRMPTGFIMIRMPGSPARRLCAA